MNKVWHSFSWVVPSHSLKIRWSPGNYSLLCQLRNKTALFPFFSSNESGANFMYLFFPPNESGTNFRCKMAHFVAFTTKLRRYPEHHPNFPPDASLVLDDGSRHAVHRLILAANSKFFKSMFQFHPMKKMFPLKQVNQKDLTTFLDYAYTKEIRLTSSQ